ncbi:MAG: PfkB family carbohydrate kinase, partial [Thermoanaerobaculia bacterium]
DVAGLTVTALDPTGAGDTFSGTTVALLQQGAHPVRAARRGTAVAAEMVQRVGPTVLLEPPPAPMAPVDSRCRVDRPTIARIAPAVAGLAEVEAFPFVGPLFPPPGHPRALDVFFAATLQQFGFWITEEERYARPMIASLGGEALKGSDFLWAAYRRWLGEAPSDLTPEGQSRMTLALLTLRLRDDDGNAPLPALEARLRLAGSFGRDLLAMGTTPQAIVATANLQPRPVAALLSALDHLGGYKEDPLRKKSALLALILRQRPEGFLRRVEGDAIPPIVDYHVQRGCLRTGVVRVDDAALAGRLTDRRLVEPADERAVRQASYQAMLELVEASGRPMEVVDGFFFRNRTRCPEMTDPDCGACPLDDVCAKEKRLFQPVHRTTYY